MKQVDRELDRYLNLLRNKIRERGFTQLEVQQALGWGRSYISQLVTKTKALRVEQVLMILNVIGIEPAEFFALLYELRGPASRSPEQGPAIPPQNLKKLQAMLEGLTGLLVKKGIVTSRDLRDAVEAETRGD